MPIIPAPRGDKLHAKSWQTEAVLRMFLNNLDREIAEDPENLIVYGGNGQAARSVEDAKKIIKFLLELEDNESLLVQSGKDVGVVKTHNEAPRVLIANSNLVPHWANWEHFNKLKAEGKMMYGQMTAGSWIYIGTQGILQGTYETFAACGRKHFNGDMKNKLVVTGGLGGMGGAQPLAATMAGATCLGVDIDPERIKKRLDTKYVDKMTDSYEEAVKFVMDSKEHGKALSIGLVGDIGDVLKRLIKDNIIPEILTDQTSAHDPINGYIPNGISLTDALALRKSDPASYRKKSIKSMARHVEFMLELQKKGRVTFDYGNNIREFAKEGGVKNAFDFPGFVPAFSRSPRPSQQILLGSP